MFGSRRGPVLPELSGSPHFSVLTRFPLTPTCPGRWRAGPHLPLKAGSLMSEKVTQSQSFHNGW